MTVRPILVVGNPVLRQKAKRVTQFDRSLHQLLDDMLETMRAAPGVGLAGPQIGVPLRVAVIEVEGVVYELVNPEVVKTSGEVELDEGCLSVPGYWGRITRAEKATVKARDRNGKEIRVRGEGLLAQALQHETDHLNGLLYVDHPGVIDTMRRTRADQTREPRPTRDGDAIQVAVAQEAAAARAER
ncbi:MAG: peptide deformylase [Chloroflexi bacterium]|nr:peptide deformylase [Chloroflexota bacterium]